MRLANASMGSPRRQPKMDVFVTGQLIYELLSSALSKGLVND
jgi:hypothetical protein